MTDDRNTRNAPPPPTSKGRRRPPEPLTPTEVHALLRAASNRSSSGLRVRALIGVLYGAGLRVNEALNLYPRDVDTHECTVRVREGKGGKARLVGIDPPSCALLDAWLARRKTLGLTGRHPIFAVYTRNGAKFGAAIDSRQVRASLARLGERAGVDKPVRPHGLRHSLAFDLAERGVPVHKIRAQLGHTNVATTSRYIDHLRPGDVIDMMRERDW
jgi:site-specific recombinase XerD